MWDWDTLRIKPIREKKDGNFPHTVFGPQLPFPSSSGFRCRFSLRAQGHHTAVAVAECSSKIRAGLGVRLGKKRKTMGIPHTFWFKGRLFPLPWLERGGLSWRFLCLHLPHSHPEVNTERHREKKNQESPGDCVF